MKEHIGDFVGAVMMMVFGFYGAFGIKSIRRRLMKNPRNDAWGIGSPLWSVMFVAFSLVFASIGVRMLIMTIKLIINGHE